MRIQQFGLLSLFLLPAIFYFFIVGIFATNIPYMDDYDVFLHYLNQSSERRTLQIFSLHNEHRIAFTRIVTESMYQLFGYIDFRILILIGNAALLAIFYLLYRLYSKIDLSLKYFWPVPYLLFFGALGENTAWATGALQNYYVLLFALMSLISFNLKNYLFFVLSIMFTAVAAFTSGSGLFILLILILWTTLDILKTKIDRNLHAYSAKKDLVIRLIAILIITTLVSSIYFHGYMRPPHHPSVINALMEPLHSLHYFFVFLGSYTRDQTTALVGGMTSISLLLYITYRKYYYLNPVIYYFAVFLALNAAAAAITRSGFGIQQALSSRYTFLSILMLIFLYIALLELKKDTWISDTKLHSIIFVVVLIIFTTSFKNQIDYLSIRRNQLIVGADEWKVCGSGLSYPDQDHATILLREALGKGFFQLP